ncbi:MAG: hypothetical protein WAK31_24480 [Chthoniobacterales bacterium]
MTDQPGSNEILPIVPNLPPQLLAEIRALFPVLVQWAERMEAKALKEGAPLSAQVKDTARVLGIAEPDAVRVLAVHTIEPENKRIVELAGRFGLSFAGSDGMTFGHAIFARHYRVGDQRLLIHELVHVRQYEKAQTIGAYLNVYVEQILAFGYQNMPLEVEAVTETNLILGRTRTY